MRRREVPDVSLQTDPVLFGQCVCLVYENIEVYGRVVLICGCCEIDEPRNGDLMEVLEGILVRFEGHGGEILRSYLNINNEDDGGKLAERSPKSVDICCSGTIPYLERYNGTENDWIGWISCDRDRREEDGLEGMFGHTSGCLEPEGLLWIEIVKQEIVNG